MQKVTLTCDGCHKEIKPLKHRGITHYLTLEDVVLSYTDPGGLFSAVVDYPIIEETAHFHDMQCLASWAMEQ